MHFTSVLASISILAGVASAAPHSLAQPPAQLQRRASGAQNVVYWGQNGGGTIENNDLSTYCTSTAGVDILVLSFLYSWGAGGTIPSGTIGQSCTISSSGEGQNCDALASAISTCQAAGVKVILSLGGASGSYSLTSDSQAQEVANNLWAAYGKPGSSSVPRPFGNTFVNGFDFDIEVSDGSSFYPAMISSLRSNFASDSSNTYYITGAPQCPLPEPNMGVIISNAQFDYLWPQFYNNNNYTYPCALPFNGNAAFNFDEWMTFTSTTPSSNAKVFIGVPAAPMAANGAPSGQTYYITPPQLASLVGQYGSTERFGGIMMWSAGFSDSNVIDGCTYAQQAAAILNNGSPCGGAPASYSIPSATRTQPTPTAVSGGGYSTKAPNPVITDAAAPTPSAQVVSAVSTTVTVQTTTTVSGSAPSATSSGTLQEWDQCGGIGYEGSTECEAPYSCYEESVWWSSCQLVS